MTPFLAASGAHATGLALIHRQAFAAPQRWSQQDFAALLDTAGSFGFLHPAGAFVLARAVADEAEILTLAVVPVLRRQGIGGSLLQQSLIHAACLGARAMFLEVAGDNRAARALYAAHGFVEIGCRRRYYPDGGDALVLRTAVGLDSAAQDRAAAAASPDRA